MTKAKKKRSGADQKKREAVPCEEGQVYGRVTRMLGNGRLLAKCSDGRERQCRIRGNMRRREWVRLGDTVLVSLRPFDDDKADVIHKYEAQDVAKLARQGEDIRIAAEEEDTDDIVRFAGEDEPDEIVDWETL